MTGVIARGRFLRSRLRGRSYNRPMAKASKGAAVFLFLFGMPFLGFGVFAVYTLFFPSPAIHTHGNPVIGAVVGGVFALVGGGLMFGAVFGYRNLQVEDATQQANPDSPWLWRKDWANGRAESLNRGKVYGWWIGTVLSSAIVVPISADALPPLLRDQDPKALLLIGFALVPAILLAGALRATLQRERYGKTYFELGALPFSPGGRVSGMIHLRMSGDARHGMDVRLSCVRRIVTGSGKNQTTNEAVLWSDEKNVPQSYFSSGPVDTTVPVEFVIPADGFETNHDQPHDQLLWKLHARADVPGVDYADDFEVPVFRVGAGAAGVEAESVSAFQSDSSDVVAPANPSVVITTAGDGATEFYFPPFRNRGQTLALFLFTAVWSGIVYFLWHSSAPWFFAAVFGFFDLVMIYGCVQSAFGSTRIVAGNGKIVSVRKIFGAGNRREFGFGEIESIVATARLQQQGTSGSYLIRLKTKSDKDFNLVENISDRQEARWIVEQLEKIGGLKRDTHVELGDVFGRELVPPPQRGVGAGGK